MYTNSMGRSEKYKLIYTVVKCIPEGKVATYGQVATLSGNPGQARQVGYALNSLPDDVDIPWQRVVNAQGRVSRRKEPISELLQRQLLESEGVIFDKRGIIDLSIFQWKPGMA
jgi:methylated-DNA-protein-cysteine methyltransferase-like protein